MVSWIWFDGWGPILGKRAVGRRSAVGTFSTPVQCSGRNGPSKGSQRPDGRNFAMDRTVSQPSRPIVSETTASMAITVGGQEVEGWGRQHLAPAAITSCRLMDADRCEPPVRNRVPGQNVRAVSLVRPPGWSGSDFRTSRSPHFAAPPHLATHPPRSMLPWSAFRTPSPRTSVETRGPSRSGRFYLSDGTTGRSEAPSKNLDILSEPGTR
jgi:hypothetical protein